MTDFSDLFTSTLPQDDVFGYLAELRKIAMLARHDHSRANGVVKQAVSTAWVAETARRGAQNAGYARTKEVAGRSMKGVLNSVKSKAPQASIDKRMALHQVVQGSPGAVHTRISTKPPMRKAAGEALGFALRGSAEQAAHAAVPPVTLKQASLHYKLKRAAEGVRGRVEGPSPETIAMAEQQGIVEQAVAENRALRGELEQIQGVAAEHAQAAEQANEAMQQQQELIQQSQMETEAIQAQAAEAMQAAQAAQLETQVHAQEAAQQADAKMRIAIRVQQMRQELANLASIDPVSEEGEAVEAIQTPAQQGLEATPEEQAAAEQQGAVEQGGAVPQKQQKKEPAVPDQGKEKAAALIKQADEARKQRLLKAIAKTNAGGNRTIRGTGPKASDGTGVVRSPSSPSHAADKVLASGHPEVARAQRNMSEFAANGGVSAAGKSRKNLIDALIDHHKTVGRRGNAGRGGRTAATIAGAAAGLGALGGAALYKSRAEKKDGKTRRKAASAQEDRARGKARHAAMASGALPGAALGGALGAPRWIPMPEGGPIAGALGGRLGVNKARLVAGALAGAGLGAVQSGLRHHARETTKDVASHRALAKERTSRLNRSAEKLAASELDDAAIDALYGLR